MARVAPYSFDVGNAGTTTALVYRARDPIAATFIFAHGSGAPQDHPFVVGMAERLAARGLDVVTFNFLYAERGRTLPDRKELLHATWRAAIASVRARGGLPRERIFIGGKSMGGRMASEVAAASPREGTSFAGLVFFGYPLHPPKERDPKKRRDAHLPLVPFPMLFVQGSRDDLGTSREIASLVKKLPNASLHAVEGGDHSLAVSKRLGPEAQEDVYAAAADATLAFVRKTAASSNR